MHTVIASAEGDTDALRNNGAARTRAFHCVTTATVGCVAAEASADANRWSYGGTPQSKDSAAPGRCLRWPRFIPPQPHSINNVAPIGKLS